jgi:molybdenum cofactor cytidylyltransferase
MAKIPLILLAAGGSARMGRPKQLLPWGNHTLIEHQIQTLQKTGNPVSVVLGSNSKLVLPVIEKYNVNIFINNDWENGMGSSIATGVNGLTKESPGADGVLIALVDQPLVPSKHFLNMLEAFHPGKQQIIVSNSGSGWEGVPALFDKCYSDELQNLTGKEGAKKIIQKHNNAVKRVKCGNLLEDMDTPEAYQQMLKKFTSQF